MGVRHYRDLIAWQLAMAFAAEVTGLVRGSPGAERDREYRNQLLGAAESVASNVAEGFLRFSRAEFRRFLDYALGSLVEAETRLDHGVARKYFSQDDTAKANRLARRALTAMVRLKQSQGTNAPVAPVALVAPVARRKQGGPVVERPHLSPVAPVVPVAPRVPVVPVVPVVLRATLPNRPYDFHEPRNVRSMLRRRVCDCSARGSGHRAGSGTIEPAGLPLERGLRPRGCLPQT